MSETLVRPKMPGGVGGDEQKRAEHQAARADLLCDRADERIDEWRRLHINEERLKLWGAPDTSSNPLSAFATQASTPGLYVEQPRVRGPEGSEGLIGSEGLLARSGLWPRLQRVQFFAVGLNSVLVRVSVAPEHNRLVFRVVLPHNVHVVAHVDDPTVPVEIWELRVRTWMDPRRNALQRDYTWDVWSVRDPLKPFFRVHLAEGQGGLGEDITAHVLGESERLDGETYPYRDDRGRPVLPWRIYRSHDDGTMFAWEHGRGAFRGSLNAMLNWSFAQHAARDASGSTNFVFDGEPTDRRTVQTQGGAAVQTVVMEAGSTTVWRTTKDSNHQAKLTTVGPGANLQQVSDYALLYELLQLVRLGVNPTDITRTNNTPTSGAAIYLSNQAKRDLQRKYEPLFREADVGLIRIAAIVARAHQLGTFPEDGYSITYAPIPLSASEQQAQREDLDWRTEHGVVTPVEAFQQLYPGASRDDAIETMARASVEKAAVERRAAELASELGVVQPTALEASNAPPATPGVAPASAPATSAPATPTDIARPEQVLNGSQTESALEIIDRVRIGRLPRASGVAALKRFFNLSTEAAEEIMGEVGRSFVATPPAPSVPTNQLTSPEETA
jgi:hypothetical protein